MARTFAYCRVSTTDQTTDNQVREIEASGFSIDPKRIVTETVSGSVAAVERKGFAKLLDRLETDDVLVVTKLDRLGRNAMDVRATVERFAQTLSDQRRMRIRSSRPPLHFRGWQDPQAGARLRQ